MHIYPTQQRQHERWYQAANAVDKQLEGPLLIEIASFHLFCGGLQKSHLHIAVGYVICKVAKSDASKKYYD